LSIEPAGLLAHQGTDEYFSAFIRLVISCNEPEVLHAPSCEYRCKPKGEILYENFKRLIDHFVGI
jgi:hypothetical protein